MASGRIIGSYLAGRGQRLEIEWEQTGNANAKTSTITCTVYVRHKTSTQNADSARGCTADCTGQEQQSWTSKAWSVSGESDLLQVLSDPITWTVPCDAQGNHTPVTLTFRYKYKNEAWVTASEEITLDRVPLASEISYAPASVTAGNSMTVLFTRYVGTYWHLFTTSIGGTQKYSKVFQAEDSATIAVGMDWLNNMTDMLQRSMTHTLITFEDQQMTRQVGIAAVASTTLVCPDTDDTRPATVSGWAAVAPDNTGTRAAGLNAYIAGITKLSGAFDSTKITAKYGAGMATKAIACEGLSDTEAFADGAPVIGPVMSAGDKAVTLTATDSRGLAAIANETVRLYTWMAPRVTELTVYRSDALGNADNLGTYIAVNALGSCSDIRDPAGTTLNGYTLAVRWRQAGLNWYGPQALTPGSTAVIGGGAISTQYAYEVEVTATDALGGTGSATETVPKSSVTLNFREGGDGACFGGYATQDGMEIDWERIAWTPPAGSTPTIVGGVTFKAEDANGVWHTYRVLGVIESTP